jgi:hypothetical protein
MNYFSICAIFKNEGPYIGDWVKYHLAIGAEHIYLYNNDSTDDSDVNIREVAGRHQVTITPIHGHPVQRQAYGICLEDHRLHSRWIAFLDIDEYLYSSTPIKELLKDYERYPCLCPHWILFGSSNHLDYAPFPVPLRFTRCQNDTNAHVKSIVNPIRTYDWVSAHRFIHDDCPVDENKNRIFMSDSTPADGTTDKIYVAHYAVKSYCECIERRSKARADTGEVRKNLEEFFAGHDRNDKENLDIANTWRKLCL